MNRLYKVKSNITLYLKTIQLKIKIQRFTYNNNNKPFIANYIK